MLLSFLTQGLPNSTASSSSSSSFHNSPDQVGRVPCCDKANARKGLWSPEEDSKLLSYILEYGTGGNWIALPKKAVTYDDN